MKSTNATKVGYLTIAIAVFAVSCSGNSPTNSQNPLPTKQTYPFTYAPLAQDSLTALKDVFLASNPDVCSGLNAFGFIGTTPCLAQGRGVSADFKSDIVSDEARDFLTKNSQFTGVGDISNLEVISMRVKRFDNGDLKDLSITFGAQILEGLRVYHSAIQVTVDSLGPIYVRGNHYPDVIIPLTKTKPDDIKEGLIDHKITWNDLGGIQREFIIDDDSFCANPTDSNSSIEFEKVVFPFQTAQGIELYVTWKIDVDRCGEMGNSSKWTLYVDVVSGEIMFTSRNFSEIGG